MAIDVNIYKAESISMVPRAGASGRTWIELVIRESDGNKHEINIFAADPAKHIALFMGINEDDA